MFVLSAKTSPFGVGAREETASSATASTATILQYQCELHSPRRS